MICCSSLTSMGRNVFYSFISTLQISSPITRFFPMERKNHLRYLIGVLSHTHTHTHSASVAVRIDSFIHFTLDSVGKSVSALWAWPITMRFWAEVINTITHIYYSVAY